MQHNALLGELYCDNNNNKKTQEYIPSTLIINISLVFCLLYSCDRSLSEHFSLPFTPFDVTFLQSVSSFVLLNFPPFYVSQLLPKSARTPPHTAAYPFPTIHNSHTHGIMAYHMQILSTTTTKYRRNMKDAPNMSNE